MRTTTVIGNENKSVELIFQIKGFPFPKVKLLKVSYKTSITELFIDKYIIII